MELQEEYGGAGAFHIPVEEHYQLEKEEWRYDRFPEFYNGSNVLDFYDKDIQERLDALEEEEAEILKMEADQDQLMEDEVIDGVATSELKSVLKQVRGKKALLKQEHKIKAKNTVHAKPQNLSEVLSGLEAKGYEPNKESIRSRSRVRKSIMDLEGNQDDLAKRALDSDDGSIVDDEDLAEREADSRGRKKRRAGSPSELMEVDDSVRKSGRTKTPTQRSISVK